MGAEVMVQQEGGQGVGGPKAGGERWPEGPAFVFDPDRCTGCEACRVACGIENGGGRDTGWRQIFTLNPGRHPALPTRHLSLACNHCRQPACMLACPAAAYRRDEATGAVLLDADKCMGCRYCSWVCPYDAPRFDEAAGVMRKCTFCSHRLEEGAGPACIEACPTAALSLGLRHQATEEPVAPGLPALGLGPALRVRPSRRSGGWTASGSGAARPLPPPRQPLPRRKIRLSAEWALLLFTLVLPALVAWLAAGLVRPERAAAPWAFLAAGAAAMGVSTLHLGRPLRAWRAVLGLRTSPLSREIALAAAFLGTAAVHLLLPAGPALRPAAGALALAFGVATLVAIDSVYRAIPRLAAVAAGAARPQAASDAGRGGRLGEPLWPARRPPVHSAEAWLTGALLVGLAAEVPAAWGLAAFLKVLLGLRDRSLPLPLLVLRLLLLAAAVTLAATGAAWPAGFLVALAGEALDRAGFYRELEPMSPGRTVAAELAAAVAR